MRRLDVVLTHASERGRHMGPDLLIEHLERRLHGERELVVAARTRRSAMVKTEERPASIETPTQSWKRWAVALAGFAVVGAAVVAAVFLIDRSNQQVTELQTPERVMGLMATAVEEADPGAFTILSADWDTDSYLPTSRLDWNLALGMDPEFTDCIVTSSSAETAFVTCNMTMGEDYFFSVVLDENLAAKVAIRVEAARLTVEYWSPPAGLERIESEMRSWIRVAHPELEDRMFDMFGPDNIRFTREAAELHTRYLDEFLAYRNANS